MRSFPASRMLRLTAPPMTLPEPPWLPACGCLRKQDQSQGGLCRDQCRARSGRQVSPAAFSRSCDFCGDLTTACHREADAALCPRLTGMWLKAGEFPEL